MSDKGKAINPRIAIQIVSAIDDIVRKTEGRQIDAGRQIDYAVHALLMIVDSATRLQTPEQRAESFRIIAQAVTDIAENEYIPHPGDTKIAGK